MSFVSRFSMAVLATLALVAALALVPTAASAHVPEQCNLLDITLYGPPDEPDFDVVKTFGTQSRQHTNCKVFYDRTPPLVHPLIDIMHFDNYRPPVGGDHSKRSRSSSTATWFSIRI